MKTATQIPIVAFGLLCTATSIARAQAGSASAIPPTAPTQSVSSLPSAQPQPVKESHGPTRVAWDGSVLTVESAGERLPEITQKIARETGMRITGGVPDERVYGKYGPASVQVVMGQLFDGLSINLLLLNGSPTQPKVLVLTGRSGAASPPQTREVESSFQPGRQAEALQPILPPRGSVAGPPPPSTPVSATDTNPTLPAPPASSIPGTGQNPGTTAPAAAATTAAATTPATTDTATPESPNGVRTPEQIFEELRRRQQANQAR